MSDHEGTVEEETQCNIGGVVGDQFGVGLMAEGNETFGELFCGAAGEKLRYLQEWIEKSFNDLLLTIHINRLSIYRSFVPPKYSAYHSALISLH